MSEPAQPFSLAPGEGKAFPTPVGGQVTFKVRGVESSGGVSVAEFDVPAGAGPRLHVHEQAEECIYVLRGELRVQLGDEAHDATAGSCVFVPRGLPHCFRNVGEEHALVLGVYTPAGIEGFFENVAAREADARGGTPGAPTGQVGAAPQSARRRS